jgi:hypothetical protein
MDVLDHLMSRENIMPRLNQRILSSATNPVRAVIYTFVLEGGLFVFIVTNNFSFPGNPLLLTLVKARDYCET